MVEGGRYAIEVKKGEHNKSRSLNLFTKKYAVFCLEKQ